MNRRGRKKLKTSLFVFIALGLVIVLVVGLASVDWLAQLLRGTAGSSGTAEVIAFSGWAEQRSAHLQWETLSEAGILGFNLYRSTDAGEPYVPLNSEPIPSQATGGGGALYDFWDAQVSEGETYAYKLEPLDGSGAVAEHGPVTVQILPISSLLPETPHRIMLPMIMRDD